MKISLTIINRYLKLNKEVAFSGSFKGTRIEMDIRSILIICIKIRQFLKEV